MRSALRRSTVRNIAVGFLQYNWRTRTNRGVANDLANGAQTAPILVGVQSRPALVRKPAYRLRRLVVVENFDRKEMKFTHQRQGYDQAADPGMASGVASSIQIFRLRPADRSWGPKDSNRLLSQQRKIELCRTPVVEQFGFVAASLPRQMVA